MGTFDIGTGYRWTKGFLNGVAGTVGLSFVGASYGIESSFSDSLFDITEQRDFRDDGLRLLPFVALSYMYKITPVFALGTQVRMRYHLNPGSFSSVFENSNYWRQYEDHSMDDKDFKYNLTSGEIHLNLIFTLRLSEVEE
jgi:hypothetical protein